MKLHFKYIIMAGQNSQSKYLIGIARCLQVLLFLIVFLPYADAADRLTIVIKDPFGKKIPIAVPELKFPSKVDNNSPLNVSPSKIISDYLNFTRLFDLLSDSKYPSGVENDGVVATNIQFDSWKNAGAEYLVSGQILLRGDIIDLELRLYDTIDKKMRVGKKYTGWVKDINRILARFCSEIVFYFTGDYGIFDSKITFVSNGDGNKEIYECNFDGSNPVRITKNKVIDLSPSWSSDGRYLAYISYAAGEADLYIKNLDTNQGVAVNHKGADISPEWMPGRFMLAATMAFEGNSEIYLLTGTGKMIRKLTQNYGIDVQPTFSPDGTKMAFVSDRAGNPQIYIMNIESGETERLTFNGNYNTSPAWSPKGDVIAYTAMVDGHMDIFRINVVEKIPIQLTYNTRDNESPSWSPDGSLLVFNSNRTGKNLLYVMTGFGTDQRALLTITGEQTDPDWSPRVTNN